MIVLIYYVYWIASCLTKYVMKSYRKNPRGQSNSVEQEVIVDSEVIYDDFGIRFTPPVYVQRYVAVCKILEESRWSGEIRKVIDFGCGELKFFEFLKNVPGIQEILEVDVDTELLEFYKCRAAPLTSDYLKKRNEPLSVHVLAGSVAEQDSRLRGTDAVICIELIEHLYPRTLDALTYTVFEYIQPKLAIFTTPNSEFNVLIPNLSGFRHDDHKFEWSRKQFMCWARNLIRSYPLYSVSFLGVGPGPIGTSRYGCCSQMAVFVKDIPGVIKDARYKNCGVQDKSVYQLMCTYEYPYEEDTRTLEEKIRDEVTHHISSYGSSHVYDTNNGDAHIPLDLLMPAVKKWCNSVNKLREVLEDACWRVVESRGELCVVYAHKRWSEWLTSDVLEDNEAAPSTLCEQETVKLSSHADREESYCPIQLNRRAGVSEAGHCERDSTVGRPECCDRLVPMNRVREGRSRDECTSGTAGFGEETFHVGRRGFTNEKLQTGSYEREDKGESDVSFQRDYAGDKNSTGHCPDGQTDKSCDVSVLAQLNGHVVPQTISVMNDYELIANNVESDVNYVTVTHVSDTKCTVVKPSNSCASSENCNEKRNDHTSQECSSSTVIDDHAKKCLADSLEQECIVDGECICDDMGIRFVPPVYVQRYMAVCKILEDTRWNETIHKVIDFGCAELGFLQYLKNVPGIQEILEVDIDTELLKSYKCRAAPFTSDFLRKRNEPLTIHVLAGSIAEQDSRLRGTDAVICIELIEHLYPDTLEALPYTVFDYIQPKVAVFTTPNSEFNVLLPNLCGFRHDDHKFEWTREQFICWARNLTTRYPQYSVSFVGIAPGPDGTSQYGCCSQMAVFVKDNHDCLEADHHVNCDSKHDNVYSVVSTYEYPFEVDARTVEEKIRDEATYQISYYGPSHMYDTENDDAHIPLDLLMPSVKKWCNSIDKLREVLEDSCWPVVESHGKMCVVYAHKRWSEWLASDDQEDEEEAAPSTLCEQETVEPSHHVVEEEDWVIAKSHDNGDQWCWNDGGRTGEGEDGHCARSVVGSLPECCDSLVLANSMQEGMSIDSASCCKGECRVKESDVGYTEQLPEECYVAAGLQGVEGNVPFHCSLLSDKTSAEQELNDTSDLNQKDLIHKNYDCVNSCDTKVEVLQNSHIVPKSESGAEDGLITENIKPVVNCAVVSQASDEMQTVANLSDCSTLCNSSSIKKSELVDRECGSPVLIEVCSQDKRFSRNSEVALEEGSTVDSYSLEEQNDKAVDGGYRKIAGQVPYDTDSLSQKDLVHKNYDVCDKSSDTEVAVLQKINIAAENACGVEDRLITENTEPVVNCAVVSQVSDVLQTVVNLSNSSTLSKSSGVKKSEHVDWECGSPALVEGCAQHKRLSRNLEVALEEGSTVDSYSLEEQNDKAVDSGYPNSTDMDLDLTPEQVDEISMENDVLLTGNSSFDEDSEYEASLSDSEEDPLLPVLHMPGEVLQDAQGEGMENGDVANNNQDEEGNNAAADPRPQVGDAAVIDFAVMLDLENENDMANVNPFPDWLLHLVGVANMGNGAEVVESSSDDENDSSSLSMHGSEQVSSAVLPQGAVDVAIIH